MAIVNLQLLPSAVITIKDGYITIDGAIDGTIDITSEVLITVGGEEAVFDGGVITFGETV